MDPVLFGPPASNKAFISVERDEIVYVDNSSCNCDNYKEIAHLLSRVNKKPGSGFTWGCVLRWDREGHF